MVASARSDEGPPTPPDGATTAPQRPVHYACRGGERDRYGRRSTSSDRRNRRAASRSESPAKRPSPQREVKPQVRTDRHRLVNVKPETLHFGPSSRRIQRVFVASLMDDAGSARRRSSASWAGNPCWRPREKSSGVEANFPDRRSRYACTRSSTLSPVGDAPGPVRCGGDPVAPCFAQSEARCSARRLLRVPIREDAEGARHAGGSRAPDHSDGRAKPFRRGGVESLITNRLRGHVQIEPHKTGFRHGARGETLPFESIPISLAASVDDHNDGRPMAVPV